MEVKNTNVKLRINFLTAYSHIQGTYFRWHNIGMGLITLGHEVTVYCVDYGDDATSRIEIRDGLEYHFVPGAKGKQYLGTINNPFTAFKRLFVNYKSCDILHVFQPFLSIYIPWKFKLKKLSKVTIFDWDDLWVGGMFKDKNHSLVDKWNYSFTGYFEKKIPSLALPMTTCSQLLKDLAVKRGNKECTIFHNGFWPYKITPKTEARKKLGLNIEAIYVGFMGRTTKELSWCFDALEACVAIGIPIRFALCGPNPDELNQVSATALEHTDYLGSLSPLATRDFAASLDLGLLPLEESTFNKSRFPIKLSEYMAAGIPVLCSQVGEMNHYINKYSWVIGAGEDKTQWLDNFVQIIKELSIDRNAFPVAMETIENDLSWLGITKKVEDIYLNSSK